MIEYVIAFWLLTGLILGYLLKHYYEHYEVCDKCLGYGYYKKRRIL